MHDFGVTLTPRPSGGGYCVELRRFREEDPNGTPLAEAIVPSEDGISAAQRYQQECLRNYVTTPPEPNRLNELGAALAAALLPSHVRDMLLGELRRDPTAIVRLRLTISDADRKFAARLWALPWEFLRLEGASP